MTYKEQKPEGYNLGALAGRAFERDRIIKALEPLKPTPACRCESCAMAHKFFDLIKASND